MKKMSLFCLMCFLLISVAGTAQTLTTKINQGGYSWNTGNASRDAAFYNGKIYVVENNSASSAIHVIDPATGVEITEEKISSEELTGFSVAADAAGKLIVPKNTAGSANCKVNKVTLPNTIGSLTGEETLQGGIRVDYLDIWGDVDATTDAYIAGASPNTNVIRVWTAQAGSITNLTPTAFTDYTSAAATGADVQWIDATHLFVTGTNLTPRIVTLDFTTPASSTFTEFKITVPKAGGGNYFKINNVPYIVVPDLALGAIIVYNVTDPENPVQVGETTAAIGSTANAAFHVAIEAVVDGNKATIYVWSPNNGFAVHELDATPQANIFASELKAEKLDATHYAFTYTLNADATSGTLNFTGGTTISKPVPNPSLLTKGTHTLTLDLGDLANGDYSWSVTATGAAAAAEPVKVSDDAENLGFHALRGLAVDNSFESPFFGRVYATEGNEATAAASIRTTNDGIYIYNAALQDVTNQSNAAYTSGVTWGLTGTGANSGASPLRLAVAPDGKVFITDWSDTHAGIWALDPANPSDNLKPVFGGTLNSAGVATEGDVQIHGSISHCYVEGTGADTKLYTFDEDLGLASGVSGNVYRYDIGTLETPFAAAPSALIYDDAANGNLQQNGNSCISPDGRGGWWISQYRAADTNPAIPSLIHYNGTSVDFISASDAAGLLVDSYQGGLALNADKSLMVLTGQNAVRVFDITFDGDGKPSLALKYTITTAYGANSFSVALDRADNVYVGGNASAFSVFALPKANNTFTTPAPASSIVQIGTTGIKTPEAANLESRIRIATGNGSIRVLTDGVKVKSYILYNVTGVRILNGTAATSDVEIPTSRLSAGVYLIQITTNEGTAVKRFIKK